LRFRVDRAPLQGLRSRADLVFASARTAVYVDGCFWHSCPEHGTIPKSNADFWRGKLARNRQRDARIAELLDENGWEAVRIWEHEDPRMAADRIEEVVRQRKQLLTSK
jgi:DNA mismatch endonuclease (patch repair protein)